MSVVKSKRGKSDLEIINNKGLAVYTITYGRMVSSMFKYLSDKEQLLEEKRKNEVLQSLVKDLEDAVIELAEIVAANEEKLQEVQNG